MDDRGESRTENVQCPAPQLWGGLPFHERIWTPVLEERVGKRSVSVTGEIISHRTLSEYNRKPRYLVRIGLGVGAVFKTLGKLVAWHSGRTSVCDRRTFFVLRSTCS